MADIKWIKITTDIFDDEKILLIESMPGAYAIITVWFKLLCLAGKQNNSGVFMMGEVAYTDKMLATIFRMKESTVTMALKTFEQFGMIEIINGVITIPNWNKHQTLDVYEKKKERDRVYQAERRAAQKVLAEKSPDSRTTRRSTGRPTGLSTVARLSDEQSSCVAVLDKEEDKEEDKDLRKIYFSDKTTKRKRFDPPTLEEIRAYCQERDNNVDPEKFFNYYTANGWHVGRYKMKDWKAAVRTWEKNNFSEQKQNTANKWSKPPEDNTDLDDLF